MGAMHGTFASPEPVWVLLTKLVLPPSQLSKVLFTILLLHTKHFRCCLQYFRSLSQCMHFPCLFCFLGANSSDFYSTFVPSDLIQLLFICTDTENGLLKCKLEHLCVYVRLYLLHMWVSPVM